MTENQNNNQIAVLCEFLNDLASQLVAKGKEQNKEIVKSIYEAVEYLKDELEKTIKESKPDLKEIKFPEIPKPEKIEFPKIEIPKFPDKLSLEEAADIVSLLKRIVSEIQKKNLNVDFKGTESRLEDIYSLIGEQIDKDERLQKRIEGKIEEVKKAIPKIPALPMERGRIKVILPDDQVIRTPLGEKVSKAIRGVFLGGDTTNPSVTIAVDRVGLAKEDGNLSYLPGLSIPPHDFMALSYTGNNLTGVVYKRGGAGGVTVATLTLTYDVSDKLETIVKT